jgi:hypothetical protein
MMKFSASQRLFPYFMKPVGLCFYPQDLTGSHLIPMPVPSASYFTVRTQCTTLYSQRQGNRTLRNVGTYLQDHMALNLRFHRLEKAAAQKNDKQQYVLTGMAQREVAQSVQ